MYFIQGLFDKLFKKYWEKLEKVKEEYDEKFEDINIKLDFICAQNKQNYENTIKLVAQNQQILEVFYERFKEIYPSEESKSKDEKVDHFKPSDERLYDEEQETINVHFKG